MSEELKVETNVPVPFTKKTGVSETLRSLKPGQSVVLNSSQSWARKAAQEYIGAGKYAVRAADGGGFRVWRIK